MLRLRAGRGLVIAKTCGLLEGLDKLAAGRVVAGHKNAARALLWYATLVTYNNDKLKVSITFKT